MINNDRYRLQASNSTSEGLIDALNAMTREQFGRSFLYIYGVLRLAPRSYDYRGYFWIDYYNDASKMYIMHFVGTSNSNLITVVKYTNGTLERTTDTITQWELYY